MTIWWHLETSFKKKRIRTSWWGSIDQEGERHSVLEKTEWWTSIIRSCVRIEESEGLRTQKLNRTIRDLKTTQRNRER